MGQVENGVAEQYHQLFILPYESARKGMILNLDDDSFSNPLPKLGLCSPELLVVTANN